jgi:hypothetical protein
MYPSCRSWRGVVIFQLRRVRISCPVDSSGDATSSCAVTEVGRSNAPLLPRWGVSRPLMFRHRDFADGVKIGDVTDRAGLDGDLDDVAMGEHRL